MPLFAECCVIIPCSTIEDFPSRLDPAGARSLLGGLTAVWHPRLIAEIGSAPTWHRSDDLPPPMATANESSDDFAVPSSDDSVGDSAGTENGHVATQPTETPVRLLVVPEVCVTTLPSELRAAVDQAAVSHHSPIEGTSHEIRIRVSSRTDTLEKIAAAVSMLKDPNSQAFGQPEADAVASQEPNAPQNNVWTDLLPSRSVICEHDFFALGYTWWQTQVLTRRLRYTSNLDHLHFENRLVEAARAFVDGRLKEATEAMHDCFDALAEERDHYFSSDPSLIDLTLLTPGTIDSWLEARSPSPQQPHDGDPVPRTSLPTPENILVDEDVAVAVADGSVERRERFRQALERNEQASPHVNSVGWLGGGPSSDFSFEEHSVAASEQRIASAVRAVRDVGPGPLTVYGRLGGGIAGEWVPAIAAAGFDGIVPVDFLNGRGFDDESKVLLGEGDQEVEALTSKPIDAEDESSFLTLSTQLGEEIDRGEIATALMVHWPGGGCDSFHDVRRAASWSLCLGRLWRIDDYFTDGERPYHHGAAPKATPASAETVADLKRRRSRLHDDLRLQSERNLIGYAALVNPEIAYQAIDNDEDSTTVVANVAASLGFPVGSAVYRTGIDNTQPKTGQSAENVLLMHPSVPAARTGVHVSGKVTTNAASVFDAASSGNGTDLIVDVPAWGFSAVGPAVPLSGDGVKPKASSTLKNLSRWLTGGGGKISKENRLTNEFMEVSIHPEHGGIEGVYSGAGRGNRFSTRLLLAPSGKIPSEGSGENSGPAQTAASKWTTRCTSMKTLHESRGRAVVELTGTFEPVAATASGPDDAHPNLPQRWQAQYRLDRGSRRLFYRVRFSPVAEESLAIEEAWRRRPVLRVATAEPTPIVRAMMREKLVRTSARSFQTSLGYVIDEDERATLIASEASTVHRRSGDRFFDSLLTVDSAHTIANGDTRHGCDSVSDDATSSEAWSEWQSFAFGFDVKHPVAAAKSFAMGEPVWAVPIASNSGSLAKASPRGWLIHPSPSSLDVQIVDVGRVRDCGEAEDSDAKQGQPRELMALHVRVIQTASRAASASLRFCRDVVSVYEVSSLSRPFRRDTGNGELTLHRLGEISNPESIQQEGDRVRWSHPSHGVVHMVVLFEIGGRV
ncbi:MAG: hypothetical protein ACF8CQ_20385 [Rhodopirellula sp. JB044]|uniref:hypothetical protein n=1 Tax=Rhodopirellula sp. JB044 TaxID=3342844 RepID=UPI00370B1C9A